MGPQERWHRDDFSVDCDSGKHTFVAVLAVVGIAVYPVGVPVAFWYLLWRDEQQRKPAGTVRRVEVGAAATDKGDSAAHVSAVTGSNARPKRGEQDGEAAGSYFSFLRVDYKPKYYYYECVILLEKMLLTGVLAFVDQGSTFQAFVGGTLTHSFPRISWILWLVLTEIHRRIRLHCLCILRDPGQNVAIRQDY